MTLISCSENRKKFNVEIFCPDGTRILVKFVRLEDVRKAIYKADYEKRTQGTSETYTPFRLEDGRSFRVEKIPPEKMMECSLRESELGVFEWFYVKSF